MDLYVRDQASSSKDLVPRIAIPPLISHVAYHVRKRHLIFFIKVGCFSMQAISVRANINYAKRLSSGLESHYAYWHSVVD